MDLRLRANTSVGAGPSNDALRSTRMISAPMSDSIMPANGPGPIPAISIIFTPVNGPMELSLFIIFRMIQRSGIKTRWLQLPVYSVN